MDDVRELLEPLRRLAVEAGERIAEAFAGSCAVEWKGPGDPVTEVDRSVNAFLCEALERLVPEAGIVAEESDAALNAAAQARETLIFVDPLDGTQEFVDRRVEFGVLLGVVRGGEAVLGVIYQPMTCTTYYAIRDGGAYRMTRGGVPERLRVSAVALPADAHAVVTRTHGSERLERALSHLGVGKRACGSAGLKAARVAEGAGDLWISPGPAGMRWDVAAGEVIVREAGGMLTDGHGRPFDYRSGLRNEAGIIASNGLLHANAVASLAYAEGR